MRNAVPFVGNPDTLLLSIAATELRIDQRQRNIRRLATSCRRAIASGMTSWPVLLVAGTFGFAVGLHAGRSHQNLRSPVKLPRVLKMAAGILQALQLLPK